ncbi:MAG: ribosome silencing factor [Proteobacteria bacterium]|nr:ribosome silencing factor [Pseudomonadota bacterium]
MTTRTLARRIAKIASDHKAMDIAVLDLRKLTSFTDFFVIASGSSDRQVQAIAEAIEEGLKDAGRRPIGEEGVRSGRWALLDYGDVVTHVFYQADREHYQLEKLWFDAPRVVFKGING